MLQLMAAKDRNGLPIPFEITWAMYDSKDRSGRNGELRTAKAILPHSVIKSKQFRGALRNIKLMDGTLVPVHIYMITHFNKRIVL